MSFGSLPSVLGNGGGVAISVIGGRGLFADGTAAAPSISFSADDDTGFYSSAANTIGIASGGTRIGTFANGGVANQFVLSGNAGSYLALYPAGGAEIVAAGTNQNITLTPTGVIVLAGSVNLGTSSTSGSINDSSQTSRLGWSATGTQIKNNLGAAVITVVAGTTKTLLNTSVDSGALLQIGTNTTTSSGGMVFGTDVNLFRSAAGEVTLNATTTTFGTSAATIKSANGALNFQSVGGQIVLTPSAGITTVNSRLTIAAGYDLRLGNAYVAGAVVGTGYITIQDSTGTTYRVPVLV